MSSGCKNFMRLLDFFFSIYATVGRKVPRFLVKLLNSKKDSSLKKEEVVVL